MIDVSGWWNVDAVLQGFGSHFLYGITRIFIRNVVVITRRAVLSITESVAYVANHADHDGTAEPLPKVIIHFGRMP